MRTKDVVTDWNGTAFAYPTDEAQNRAIGYAVKEDAQHAICRGQVWRAGDFFRLLKTKKDLEKALHAYRDGKIPLQDVYAPFNEGVLRGRSPDFINAVVDRYAHESADNVDGRILRPLRKLAGQKGILSVSYEYSIQRLLEYSGFGDVFDPGNIVAHRLMVNSENRKSIGFSSGIYGRKGEVLEDEFFRKRHFGRLHTYYLGDDPDDEPVASLLPAGHFIVPFLAPPTTKQRFAEDYGAFVPENEADLESFLLKT